MKKYISILLIVIFCFSFIGCGSMEKIYDEENYESLTNENGDIGLYSGGRLINRFDNVKILYSSSDSFALWFITKDGKKIYWQGEALIHLK